MELRRRFVSVFVARWTDSLRISRFQIEQVCQFYIGDMVTAIQKTSLVPGSDDSLIYSTISGKIGVGFRNASL